MKIAIVEDEIALANELKSLLNQLNQFEITIFESGEAFLFEIESNSFDLVFLDIQMKKLNGLDTAKELRKFDKHVYIVFLTNDSSYVFDGYEVDAIRYWLKPVKEDKLLELIHSLNIQKPYSLWNVDGEMKKIYEEDILYIESDKHYVICHTKDGVLRKKDNFSTVCKSLSENFILCHRSYCVNLNHVHKLTKEGCFMDNMDMIIVSRSMKKQLHEQFMRKCKEDMSCNF